MARLRPAKCHRSIEKRAFTRKSKYKKKSFVRGIPGSKIQIFDMGAKNKKFPIRVSLYAKEGKVVRHNALEASRITANKYLSAKVGKENYHFKIKTYPHHVLREHAIAAGAGADRYSSGMQKAFGKCVGVAARIKRGTEIAYVEIDENNISYAKECLRKVGHKMPCKTFIEIQNLNEKN